MFTALEYILIDIANHAGFDKYSYEERIEKALYIVNIYRNGEADEYSLWQLAESPFELRNALEAYVKGDLNHVVGLDAVNQALQLYGVLTGDIATSSLASLGVNVRSDAYQMLADELNHQLSTTVFNRNNCKKALMITLYGSTVAYTKVLEAMKLSSQMELAELLKLPKDTYSDNWFEAVFSSAMTKIAPKAVEAMEVLQELNNHLIGTYTWVMPDGFKVKYDVKSEQQVEIKATSRSGINFSYSASHKVYAPSKFNRGMSPNIIHSVDGYVARRMVEEMGDRFISTIHDQFNFKACDAFYGQQCYLSIMCEILDSDLLNNIILQINPNTRTIQKSNTLTKEAILQSTYAIS